MITLLIILLTILAISTMLGSFVAIIITFIAIIIGYFIGAYGALIFVVLIAVGSGIYKYKNKT
ncbi:MAG: hypothetical protein KAJ49_02130 [Arcobacteraceae bacterium]|nr:hypothetical protein [Arcobacteraceae bacterium]